MLTKTVYGCSICNTFYESEQEARTCENRVMMSYKNPLPPQGSKITYVKEFRVDNELIHEYESGTYLGVTSCLAIDGFHHRLLVVKVDDQDIERLVLDMDENYLSLDHMIMESGFYGRLSSKD